MKKRPIGILILMFCFSSCEEEFEILGLESKDVHQISTLNFVNDPSPARTGPLKVCPGDYAFNEPHVSGKLYVPVTNTHNCEVNGKYPLVLISHADGVSTDYQSYDQLGHHLASHGFVVASIDRFGLGADEAFDDLLRDNLTYLYNHSQVKNRITSDVGLIGHSAGGRAVIKYAGIINEFDKNLKALIVLAPTIDLDEAYNFQNETSAFLGLHVVADFDNTAFGNKVKGQVMQSTFKIYDDAGLLDNDKNHLSLTKDMIFANTGGHYFQNTTFAKSYINAFLKLHVKHQSLYQNYFKYQKKIPGLNHKVYLQHQEPKRLVIADFENKNSSEWNSLGGKVIVSGNGISNFETGAAYLIDDYSPHHTRVAKFDWNNALSLTGNTFATHPVSGKITFTIPKSDEIPNYKYLSFRITQVYHEVNNPTGDDINFEVIIADKNHTETVTIETYGGLLHFPVKMVAPTGAIQEEQTKNAMRSYLLPLEAFESVNLKLLEKIEFKFSLTKGTTTFILDDLALYK